MNGDSNMDNGDNDDNQNGAKGIEGDEPFNDDKGHDGKACENIENKDNIGIFDWNEIDVEIEEEYRDHA